MSQKDPTKKEFTPQQLMELLYSRRRIRNILKEVAGKQAELETLNNWMLKGYVQLQEWLDKAVHGQYKYASKNTRLQEVQAWIDDEENPFTIHELLLDILACVFKTKQKFSADLSAEQSYILQDYVGWMASSLPRPVDKKKYPMLNAPQWRAVTAAECLAIMAKDTDDGLYTILRQGSNRPILLLLNPGIWENSAMTFLLDEAYDWIADTRFNLPLIEPPKQVQDNFSCGYHLIHERLLLNPLAFHEKKLAYKPINILNAIEWVLDPNVRAEAEVVPGTPDTTAKYNQYIQLVNESQQVYQLLDHNAPRNARDMPYFWLTWQYDSRGRMYDHGYHVHFQASEYKKACLSFNRWEDLNESIQP